MKALWKRFQVGAIVVSACMLVLGIIMLVWPEISAITVCMILGALCVVAGVYKLVRYFRIGFAGVSAGAMLALASALWLRDKQIDCGKIAGVLLWYGLYGLRDSVTRRLLGGVWDGLTQQDLQMYEEAYLSNDADRESPYYCLFNNDLTREVPPCFIAGAEFDPLLDDSRLLYQTLAAHQQPCEFKLYPGTLHAFLHYSRMMKTADEALRDGAQFFTAQL